MRYISDLHIHSKYSRACSRDLEPKNIERWCRLKGIDIVGSADFTHPYWFKELLDSLVEEKPGLFKIKGSDGKVLFLLTTELSCIYSQGGKVRRLHICLLAPGFSAVEKIIKALEKRGVNLAADGRPIMGLSALEILKIALDIDEKILVIPAHAWTPWFSVFGSHSGFDSMEECFGEFSKYIYSIETGLSSDPPMNWRLSALDKITLISNSDAHSPANLGREANVFEIDPAKLSYNEIYRIIKEKDKSRFLYTIEFFPEEGKYHLDGHRQCGVVFSPVETKKNKGICPVCKKPLTIGVYNRVAQLADRPEGFKLDSIPYKSLVPLQEIIADILGVGKGSKKVISVYTDLVNKGGSEFRILLDLNEDELSKIAQPEIVLGIKNVRSGKVEVSPGYDGEFGVVKTLLAKDKKTPNQKSLF